MCFGLRRARDERRPARQKVALEPQAGVLLEGSRWHPRDGRQLAACVEQRIEQALFCPQDIYVVTFFLFFFF